MKYEANGKDESKPEPTLVEKAQQEEAKAKANKPSGALLEPHEVEDAMQRTTLNHQDIVNDARVNGTSKLESVLTNGTWSQEELETSTTGPSKTPDGKKVADLQKEEAK